jgi:hypothetical protein
VQKFVQGQQEKAQNVVGFDSDEMRTWKGKRLECPYHEQINDDDDDDDSNNNNNNK